MSKVNSGNYEAGPDYKVGPGETGIYNIPDVSGNPPAVSKNIELAQPNTPETAEELTVQRRSMELPPLDPRHIAKEHQVIKNFQNK